MELGLIHACQIEIVGVCLVVKSQIEDFISLTTVSMGSVHRFCAMFGLETKPTFIFEVQTAPK